MILVERCQEVRDDDVHLQFGKPHAEAGMPCQTPACITILHFLVLSPFRKVARRIPQLRIGIDGRILVDVTEMINLVGSKCHLAETQVYLDG